jgi:hypothetical protein
MDTPLVGRKKRKWQNVRSNVRYLLGICLEYFGAPARVREFEYVDPVTNDTVYLATGARYSVLHVGCKAFFFNRVTGQFDGTGELLEERVADRLELLD